MKPWLLHYGVQVACLLVALWLLASAIFGMDGDPEGSVIAGGFGVILLMCGTTTVDLRGWRS